MLARKSFGWKNCQKKLFQKDLVQKMLVQRNAGQKILDKKNLPLTWLNQRDIINLIWQTRLVSWFIKDKLSNE